MINSPSVKILFSFLILIFFFFGKSIALIGLIAGSLFLINELIQKKIESIGIFFMLMYLYTGLKSMPGFRFQYIEAVNQEGEGRGVSSFILPEFLFDINIGSFDLSLPFIVSTFFFAYFVYTIFKNSQLFAGIHKIVIILFVLALISSIIGFVKAALMNVNGSLAATKTLFGLSVLFFGYTYAKVKSSDIIKVLFILKNKYIYVLALLLIIGLMYNHILFIYLGVAASIAVYVLLFEKNIIKFMILFISIILGSINSTFTIMIIPLVSGLITFLSFKFFSYSTRDMLPKIGFILYIVFLVFILSAPKQEIQLQENITTEGRLYNKIYGDRFFVWNSYLEEIKNANPFFVIPEESIKLETVYEIESEISFGAHNSLLQLLYYFGVVFGSILFFILFYIINKMIVVSKYLPKFIQAFALGLFGVFIVFGLTGHSIITHAASLFFWLFVGLIAGLGEQMKQNNMLKVHQLTV